MTTLDLPDLIFSVVIPCRNEEANVMAIASSVIHEMEKIGEPFDLIFIDNASTDTTVSLIRELCRSDPRIKLIVNARNFGQLRSPAHAIYQARGKAIISLCADFQDPPELIGPFVDRWRAGADMVFGIRKSENSSPTFLRWWRSLSYAFVARFGDYPVIPNATGFGLYDRKVVQAAAALNEPEPFLRGMFVETGYSIATIPYSRPERARGISNNNVFSLIDFTLSSLSGASKRVLRAPFYIGTLFSMVAGLLALMAIVAALRSGAIMPWLVAAAIEFQIALLFIFLGLQGDQVRVISERTRGTPLVVERERVNFPPEC